MVLKSFEVEKYVEAINIYFPFNFEDCDYNTCKYFVNRFCEDNNLGISMISVDKIIKELKGDK